MTKIVIVAVFIFWVAIAFFYANNLVQENVVQKNVPINQSSNQNNKIVDSNGDLFTVDLVAQHNTPSDCWVTADNNVYNVTSYIYAHPGGAGNITAYCGGDIAAAFASQGHSNNAVNIMASYKIGVLGGSVDNSTVESVNNNPINRGNGGDDDDYDDEWDD